MLVNGILAAVAAVVLVGVFALTFRKFGLGEEDDAPDGATSSHTGAMLSALFLLVYAIALIVPWATNDEAAKNARAEAHALTEVYWDAREFPAPQQQQVRDQVKDYTNFVIDKEWPVMADDGELSSEATKKLVALRKTLYDMTLKTENEENARGDAMERVMEIQGARQQRGVDAGASLPPGVLLFTVLTGVIMIVFPYLAGARPRGMALIPLGLMAALLGASTYLAFNINHTFTGALGVEPDAFVAARQEYQNIP